MQHCQHTAMKHYYSSIRDYYIIQSSLGMCRELVPRPAHYTIWGCRSPIHKTAKYLHTASTYPPAYFKLQYLIQCKWMLCKYLLHCFVVGIMTSLYMFRCSHNRTCIFSRHKLKMHSQQMTLFSYATVYLTQLMLNWETESATQPLTNSVSTVLGVWLSFVFLTFWNSFQYFYSSQVIT